MNINLLSKSPSSRTLANNYRGDILYANKCLCIPFIMTKYEIVPSKQNPDKYCLYAQVFIKTKDMNNYGYRMLCTESIYLVKTLQENDEYKMINDDPDNYGSGKIITSKDGYQKFVSIRPSELKNLEKEMVEYDNQLKAGFQIIP